MSEEHPTGYWRAMIKKIPRKVQLSKAKGNGILLHNHITGRFSYFPPEGSTQSEIDSSMEDFQEVYGRKPELVTRLPIS